MYSASDLSLMILQTLGKIQMSLILRSFKQNSKSYGFSTKPKVSQSVCLSATSLMT